jgi:hypothetical protein
MSSCMSAGCSLAEGSETVPCLAIHVGKDLGGIAGIFGTLCGPPDKIGKFHIRSLVPIRFVYARDYCV